MSKKISHKEQEASLADAPVKTSRIGILASNFVQCIDHSPHVSSKCYVHWPRDKIVRKEEDLQELLKLGAPIEVYYQDADGRTEG